MGKRDIILDLYADEEFLFVDDMDDAIIGVSNHFKIVYSTSKIIDILKRDMSELEAIEYFEFNIECAYMGDKTPIYVYDDIFI